MRSQADGAHKLTLQLTPPELGRVEVDVHIQAGEVRVHLRAADAAAGSLLHESLGELRRGLEAQGLRVADVAVDTRAHDHGDPNSSRRELDESSNRAGTDRRAGSDDDDATRQRAHAAPDPVVDAPSGLHQLDLHL